MTRAEMWVKFACAAMRGPGHESTSDAAQAANVMLEYFEQRFPYYKYSYGLADAGVPAKDGYHAESREQARPPGHPAV